MLLQCGHSKGRLSLWLCHLTGLWPFKKNHSKNASFFFFYWHLLHFHRLFKVSSCTFCTETSFSAKPVSLLNEWCRFFSPLWPNTESIYLANLKRTTPRDFAVYPFRPHGAMCSFSSVPPAGASVLCLFPKKGLIIIQRCVCDKCLNVRF